MRWNEDWKISTCMYYNNLFSRSELHERTIEETMELVESSTIFYPSIECLLRFHRIIIFFPSAIALGIATHASTHYTALSK